MCAAVTSTFACVTLVCAMCLCVCDVCVCASCVCGVCLCHVCACVLGFVLMCGVDVWCLCVMLCVCDVFVYYLCMCDVCAKCDSSYTRTRTEGESTDHIMGALSHSNDI